MPPPETDKIYILDEIVVHQSQCEALRAAYFERYAPSARARGMALESAWFTPPIELPDRSVTLYFLWSVAGVAEWWQMRLGAARADPERDAGIDGDEEKTRWWRFVDDRAISRKRSFLRDMVRGDAHVLPADDS